MVVSEVYTPVSVAIDTAQAFKASAGILGGFIGKTAGTLTIAVGGTTILNAFPVTIGWNAFPVAIGIGDGIATTAGGASGLLCVR